MTGPSYPDLSVIIVDDIRATRAILKALLRGIGIQNIAEAGDGTEALKILQSSRKDLIITDLSMAPMNGIELTRQVRQPKSLNAFVPVLMVSGHSEGARIKEAVGAGVSAFLLKPITPLALTRKIRVLMERPLPVVRANSYHGPDRRHLQAPVRKNRRSDIVLI